uniref:Uncharacterized protein n=1 Tax=Nothobranchius furzeri TaxID=105023 RepID=A0A8C6LL46_NOTFU
MNRIGDKGQPWWSPTLTGNERFERFRVASNLDSSTDVNQVNTLVYCMGDEANDMLRGLDLMGAQRQRYDAVKLRFDRFFVPRKNVIYKWAKFNKRVQQPAEPVDAFIMALYALAENYEYSNLHDELLRDRLVVGLKDSSLSEKMQIDKDLTLAKAITMAKQLEEIKRQVRDPLSLSLSLCPWARHLTHIACWWWSEGPVAPVLGSLASVSAPQGSCGYIVVHPHQCVNVCVNG